MASPRRRPTGCKPTAGRRASSRRGWRSRPAPAPRRRRSGRSAAWPSRSAGRFIARRHKPLLGQGPACADGADEGSAIAPILPDRQGRVKQPIALRTSVTETKGVASQPVLPSHASEGGPPRDRASAPRVRRGDARPISARPPEGHSSTDHGPPPPAQPPARNPRPARWHSRARSASLSSQAWRMASCSADDSEQPWTRPAQRIAARIAGRMCLTTRSPDRRAAGVTGGSSGREPWRSSG